MLKGSENRAVLKDPPPSPKLFTAASKLIFDRLSPSQSNCGLLIKCFHLSRSVSVSMSSPSVCSQCEMLFLGLLSCWHPHDSTPRLCTSQRGQFFFSFEHPSVSLRVPPYQPASAQCSLLLKGHFSQGSRPFSCFVRNCNRNLI